MKKLIFTFALALMAFLGKAQQPGFESSKNSSFQVTAFGGLSSPLGAVPERDRNGRRRLFWRNRHR